MAGTVKEKTVLPIKTLALAGVAAVLVIAALLTLLPRKETKATAVRTEPAMGSLQCNLSNGGLAVSVGDDVYLSDLAQGGQIVKVKAGSVQGTPVGTLKGRSLNVSGSTLYYVDAETQYLMKADLDGSNPTVLVDQKTANAKLADNWLYYLNVSSGNTLCRIDVEGGGDPEMLCGERVMQYAFTREKILYQDLNDAGVCCLSAMDGTAGRTLPVFPGQSIFTFGALVFYSDEERDGEISYIMTDDEGVLRGPFAVETGVALCPVADSRYLYYIGAEDGRPYRIAYLTADAQPEKLSDTPMFGLQLINGHLYYYDVTEDMAAGCMPVPAST